MTEKDDPGEICARCGEGRHLHFGEHCLSSRDVNYNPHCTFAVSVAPAGASEPPSAFTLGQEFVSRVTSSNAPEGPSVIGPIERDEELVTFALELAVATLGAEGCACQPEEPCALCMCKEAVAHLRDTSPAPVSPVEPTPEQRCGSSDPERRRPTPEGSTR